MEGAYPLWRLSNGPNKANIIFPSGGMTRRFWNVMLL